MVGDLLVEGYLTDAAVLDLHLTVLLEGLLKTTLLSIRDAL